MRIRTVTITGADDRVDPADLLDLSQEFPYVEWGILLSWKRYGTPRYPSPAWIQSLQAQRLKAGQEAFSAHLCGDAMRSAIGNMKDTSPAHPAEWMLPIGISPDQYDDLFGRTQLNFNAQRENLLPEDMAAVMTAWSSSRKGCLITQENASNSGIWRHFQAGRHDGRHHVLIDGSGGRGVSPEAWPNPFPGVYTGFAGGLSPSNLRTEISRIRRSAMGHDIWIDMETGIRTGDQFDMSLVRDVLEICKEFTV